MDKIIWHISTFEDLTTTQLYKIMVARQEVFLIEQKVYYLDADNTDQVALHIWAEQNGEFLAYARLFPKGIKYAEASIGRVLTTSKARGKGIGKRLVAYAVECIENRFGTNQIRISAQDYLIPFYQTYGFIETDKKYLEDQLPHTEMVRNPITP